MATILSDRIVWTSAHAAVTRQWYRRIAWCLLAALALAGLATRLLQSASPATEAPASSNEPGTTSQPAVVAVPPTNEAELLGLTPLERCSHRLAAAQAELSGIETIRAVFHRQERVHDELGTMNLMELKLRREPLSVYLRWHQPSEGQEAIWQEGAYNNRLLAHPGGWRRKLAPLVKLDPLSPRAMEGTRRPIHMISIWSFTDTLALYVAGPAQEEGVEVELHTDARVGDRPCERYTFTHPQVTELVPFHRIMVFVDPERRLPIGLQNYGFPATEGEEPPLLESYSYQQLTINPPLTDLDFSVDNPAYQYCGR